MHFPVVEETSGVRVGIRARVILVVGLLFAPLLALPAHKAAAADDFVISGYGWGHGRGMGQYGALGYAVNHGWTWQEILGHYYGGTTLANDAGNPTMTVRLDSTAGTEMIVTAPGMVVQGAGADLPVDTAAVRIGRTGTGKFALYTGPGCGGPWSAATNVSASALTVHSDAAVLQLCKVGGTSAYRGDLRLIDTGATSGTTSYVVNALATEDYIRGVVPNEMSASWANLGGGKGVHALRAQAVAARSYALGENRYTYAKTCDTASCQVYKGVASEQPQTNQAIADTAGHVMRHSNGTIARTEFAASTGGYTAGGTFPAVVDAGDENQWNSSHKWTVSFSRATLAQKLGVADVKAIRITKRNGLGADGGRVVQAEIDTGTGVVTRTGDQIRLSLGLKSDWYSIAEQPPTPNEFFVRAAYLDILGRAGDAEGIAYWTGMVTNKKVTRKQMSMQMLRSVEATTTRVERAYSDVFGREPDAGGLAYWVNMLKTGMSTEKFVAMQYASQEAYDRAGGTDEAWVTAVFQRAVGRAPTAAELSQFTKQTNRQGPAVRGVVATAIYRYMDSARNQAEVIYQLILKRPADPVGRDYYANLILATNEEEVMALLASSEEYFIQAQTR